MRGAGWWMTRSRRSPPRHSRSAAGSELHECPELDHAVERQPEKIGRRSGVLRHASEERLPPPDERIPCFRGHQSLAAQIIDGVVAADRDALAAALGEDARKLRRLQEAEPGDHAVEPTGERGDRE